MFGIGAQELVVIAVIALIVFGPERLPELAAQLGRFLRDVRRLSDELTDDLRQGLALDETAPPDRRQDGGPPAAPTTPRDIDATLAGTLRVETIPLEPAGKAAPDLAGSPLPEEADSATTGGATSAPAAAFRERRRRATYRRRPPARSARMPANRRD